jgi:Xaa-Pro dipeptidase
MASAAEHRERVRAAMDAADVDLLVLGREANARYVSGANRLWLAGTRPFAPSCVLVGATGALHLLNVTDDGVPSDIPRAHLYPISWNPANLVAAVAAAADGVAVRRIGVDGMSPLFALLFRGAFPDAELVDGEALLRAVRRIKSVEDVAAIRDAVAVTEAALATVRDAARPGVDAVTLAGVFEERMGALGVTTPAFDPDITVDGTRVSARVGVERDGWEGTVTQTWPDGDEARDAVRGALDGLRPGARVADVTARGVTLEGVGLGHEVLQADDVLAPGMVVLVGAARGGARWAEPVWLGDRGPERLASA